MLFSIAYVFIHLRQRWIEKRRKMNIIRLSKNNLEKASLVFRNLQKIVPNLSESGHFSSLLEHTVPWEEVVVEQNKTKQIVVVKPKQKIDFRDWTAYINSQSWTPDQACKQDHMYVLLEAFTPDDTTSFLTQTFSVPKDKRVKVVDHTTPIAWHPGSPFGIVVECPVEDYAILGKAFMDGYLAMDDVMEIQEMISVDVMREPVHLLRSSSESDYGMFQKDDSPLRETRSHGASGGIQEEPIHECEIIPEFYNEDTVLVNEEEDAVSINFFKDTNESSAKACQRRQSTESSATKPKKYGQEELKMKPPNILIYCGKKDSARLYEVYKKVFEQCFNRDCYTLYHLKHEQVPSVPWRENTSLLIICSDKLYDNTDAAFLDFFTSGGKILSFCSPVDEFFLEKEQTQASNTGILSMQYKSWQDVTVICNRYSYRQPPATPGVKCAMIGYNRITQMPVIAEISSLASGGKMIVSQVNLDKDASEMAINAEIFTLLKKSNPTRFEILRDLISCLGLNCDIGELPQLTVGHLWTKKDQSQKCALLSSIESRAKDGILKSQRITLHFLKSLDTKSPLPTPDKLPVICGEKASSSQCKFDFEVYRRHLTTQNLGQVMIYADVLPTTMTVLDGLLFSVPDNIGLIAVAGRQTSGKGRGGNSWLSPEGCAMFSLYVRIPLESELGKRLPYLQHITAVAVVQALRTMDGYEDIDLRLKWPNDLYYSNEVKLGGIIVQSTIMHRTVHAIIGCGFNVSNSNPTMCINDLIVQHNKSQCKSLPLCTPEQLIARTVTCIEQLINVFQHNHGVDAFLPMYYDYWLHSGTRVRLESEGGLEVTIQGLDDHGYLEVLTDQHKKLSVTDDNNSFDMMKNLILFRPGKK